MIGTYITTRGDRYLAEGERGTFERDPQAEISPARCRERAGPANNYGFGTEFEARNLVRRGGILTDPSTQKQAVSNYIVLR